MDKEKSGGKIADAEAKAGDGVEGAAAAKDGGDA